jgi:riboflavin synthase
VKVVFSGIITDVGEVIEVSEQAAGLRRLRIACSYESDTIEIGASIACSGPCLTVVARGRALATVTGERGSKKRGWFAVDAAAETLRVTTAGAWRLGTRLNLERALRLGDELGGHLVTGHIDAVAEIVSRDDHSEMASLGLRAPADLMRFIAPKGSVALDGVSLTVNRVQANNFSVLIIPHTLKVTTLGELSVGARVNLEVDLIARYAARLLQAGD